MGFSRLSRYDSYFGGADNAHGGRIVPPPLVAQHFTLMRVVWGDATVTHPSTNTLLNCSDFLGALEESETMVTFLLLCYG